MIIVFIHDVVSVVVGVVTAMQRMSCTLCLSNKVDVVVTEDKTSKFHYELFWINLYLAIWPCSSTYL